MRRGLTRARQTLPPYLFYDDEGSRLYERITELPEYYLTRAERAIFAVHADAIVAAALAGEGRAVERRRARRGERDEDGAAPAKRCFDGRGGVGTSRSTCRAARSTRRRVASRRRCPPSTCVRSSADHRQALESLRRSLEPPVVALFIGSSVGNFEDDAAARALARAARRRSGARRRSLLGADLRKDPATLLPAYDDAAGVTAAFN